MDENIIKTQNDDYGRNQSNSTFNSKIMLPSIIILFVACFIVAFFHIYAGLFYRRQNHHLRRLREGINANYFGSCGAFSQALEPSILKTLPIFVFSTEKIKPNDLPLECSVCLSEFEDDELGRILPKCCHFFHVQCIDIWFQSRSDCPICRSPVQIDRNLDEVFGLGSGFSSVLNNLVFERVEDQGMVCSTNSVVSDDKKLPESTGISSETPVISRSFF